MIVISTRTYSAVSRLVSCHSSEQDVMCVIMAMRWRVGLAMACRMHTDVHLGVAGAGLATGAVFIARAP